MIDKVGNFIELSIMTWYFAYSMALVKIKNETYFNP